ncbi:MAG: hypothetical protein ACRECH_08625 [Nitrososphaerales archaeon]
MFLQHGEGYANASMPGRYIFVEGNLNEIEGLKAGKRKDMV